MGFDNWIDSIANRLKELARAHDKLHEFDMDPELERLIAEFVKVMREERGMERPESYERFNRAMYLAFEEAHPGEVWKAFYIHGERVCAYTLDGESRDEEAATVAHLACERGVDPDDVMVEYEQREVAA